MITKYLLDELKRLEKKAAPGPWLMEEDTGPGQQEYWGYWHDIGPLSLTGKKADAHGRLVIAMRNNIVALIEELEAARKKIVSLQTEHAAHEVVCRYGETLKNLSET